MRYNTTIIAVLIIVGVASLVSAQEYPSKPVRIVTAGVGGGGDFASRQIAQRLTATLGQPVVVDNRGGGVVPGQVVSQAAPDGYTLLVQGATFWIGALLQHVPYDVIKDFSPIALIMRQPNVLVVHPSLPVKSVKELVALAKSRPGALNLATGPVGSSSQLAAALFQYTTGTKLITVPYKGAGQAVTDLVSGQVQLTFEIASVVMPHVQSGKLRPLAVTTAEPSPLVPGLPTVAASGLPGFESAQMSGIFAPARTPDAIINRLNQEIVRALRTIDLKEIFLRSGVEPVGSSPSEFAAVVKDEIAKFGKVIKAGAIRAD